MKTIMNVRVNVYHLTWLFLTKGVNLTVPFCMLVYFTEEYAHMHDTEMCRKTMGQPSAVTRRLTLFNSTSENNKCNFLSNCWKYIKERLSIFNKSVLKWLVIFSTQIYIFVFLKLLNLVTYFVSWVLLLITAIFCFKFTLIVQSLILISLVLYF